MSEADFKKLDSSYYDVSSEEEEMDAAEEETLRQATEDLRNLGLLQDPEDE